MRAASVAIDAVRARSLDGALDRFIDVEPGRSIAVEVLVGPAWRGTRGADAVRPAASLLKVALVVAVLRAGRAGSLRLDAEVRHHELPPSRFHSLIDVLDLSHVFTVRELCGLAMATSDNPVAEHLLHLIGVPAVNRVLYELGCTNSVLATGFSDEHLGPSGRANVATAVDMLRLLRHLHEDPDLHEILRAMESSLQNTRIPLRMPDDGTVRVAHKTGSLTGVVNDVGIVRGDGIAMSVAVLCDGQRDAAATSIDIGDCVLACWGALGGHLGT